MQDAKDRDQKADNKYNAKVEHKLKKAISRSVDFNENEDKR